MKTLTPRQQDALNVIVSTVKERGYPPSIRELADAMNLKSTTSAFWYLQTLQEKGWIERVPDQARAIRIVEAS